MWKVSILTLFPELYPGSLSLSVSGKALHSGLWSLDITNIRNFAQNKHRTVDSRPFGGGRSMLLRPDILGEAIEKTFLNNKLPIIYPSPRGHLFNQDMAKLLVKEKNGINIVCGRFEGIDERIIENYNIQEVSIGDYIISSGDLAAFILIDCCLRMLPGYFKNKQLLKEESFGEGVYNNLLEYPHFTKPKVWKSYKVPDILTCGNEKKIFQWRLNQSKKITKSRRTDLWQKYLKGEKQNELS